MRELPTFRLEAYMARWEFSARHHLTASDAESFSLPELLEIASPADRLAFEQQWLGYTETRGAPDLRQEISGLYDNVAAEDVLCFAGAEEGIFVAMNALLSADDHAIVVVPAYQSLEAIPASLCAVSGVPLLARNGWELDPQMIADAVRPNTRALVINFPHNPTGCILPEQQFLALIDICRRHGLYLFSDEAYRPLGPVGARHLPAAVDVYERGVSLGVLSKAYGLPGLRVGWIAARDRRLLSEMEHLKHYLSICNAGPSERLAVIALRGRERLLARNRQLISENLGLIEPFFERHRDLFDWTSPQGGCIAFPRYKGEEGVEAFTRRMVEEHGIFLLPASIFTSEFAAVPTDRFRVGVGRRGMAEALAAWEIALVR